MSGFDLARFMNRGSWGHGGRLGITLHAVGDDWVEMALPYAEDLIGDADSGVLASGPIIALMDMTTSLAVWKRVDAFVPLALRAARRRVRGVVPRARCRGAGSRGRCARSATIRTSATAHAH